MVNNKYKLSNLFLLTKEDGSKEYSNLAKFCRQYELNYSLLHRKIAEFGHWSIAGVGTFEKAEPRQATIEEQQFVKLLLQDENIALQLVYKNGMCIVQDSEGQIFKLNFRNPHKTRIYG